jgi:hypothetical protein
MADGLQTYPFEFRGGLISNLSPLQQGTLAPGSARLLKNFEPSTDGGYKRIEGYAKYSSSFVPVYGAPLVQGSGQTGTTLVLANIYTTPVAGDTLTIAGVTGVYTIAASGVSFNSTHKQATLTLTTSLASSPSDKAAVTFGNHLGTIKGIAAWNETVLSYRNSDIFTSTGTTHTKINKPVYGTVLVAGGAQTGTTLNVDGLTSAPQIGDTFSIAGVEKVYTVLAVPTITTGAASLSIFPALASSPADNAALTMLSCDRSGGSKLRFAKYRINNIDKVMGVDGFNTPFIWDGTTFTEINSAPSDVIGASFITYHKNQMFFAKGEVLTFTSPYTDSDFAPANGSGVIAIGGIITGIIAFREALIIFTDKTISQLVGNTLQDFVLQPVTTKVGCVASDTIQEIGGDVIFLGPEGLRLFGATDRVGDFTLGVVSKPIQAEMTSLILSSSSFASCVIKQKSQYRVFGYTASGESTANAKGVLGTQMVGNDTASISWAETIGIKAYVVDSDYENQTETVIFAHDDGFVYKMENGNSFDGSNIVASFATPFVTINDPRIRKTFYKLFLYTDPEGSVTNSVNLKFDFDTQGSVQPDTIILSNEGAGDVSFYGNSLTRYGTSVFGGKLVKQFETQVIGSAFSVSLQFTSDGLNPPFSLDAATLEFATHDRR